MNRWLVLALIWLTASGAFAAEDPYFHAIYCKAVWSELTDVEKARVPGTGRAIAAIDAVLNTYVASRAKTARDIDSDISDLKAYSNFEAHHVKDWRACVAFYAPAN
jgi:hypothetical protein